MAQKPNLSILEQLFRSKNIYSVLYNLKTLKFSDSTKKVKQALKHPTTFKTIFHESSVPQDYSKLRYMKALPFSENLEGEIAWYIQSLSKYSDLINDFIKISSEFEYNILLDDYSSALSNLKKIDNEICKSYWGIENLFSTIQNQEGDEGNWALLKELNSKSNDYYTLFFNGIFSKKAESGITLLQYKRDLEAEMNSKSIDDKEYLLFKLGYFFVEDYSQYAYMIYLENSSSIIDKYLTLIDVISELSNSDDSEDLVSNIIDEIETIGIRDTRLNRLKEINGIDAQAEINQDLLNIFDDYSVGKYESAIEDSKLILKKYPHCIEVYEIIIKCQIELSLSFEKTGVSVYIDNILQNLFSIYTRDANYYTSRENLLKIYLTYPRVNFFKKLLALLSNLTGIKSTKNVLSNNLYVYSKYSNPELILTKAKLKNYFRDNSLINNHVCYAVNHSIAINDFEKISKINIPQNKLEIYKARSSFMNKSFIDTIVILENVLLKSDLKSYIEEEAIYLLFHAYLFEEKYDKAISLMVDSYFKNRFYTERLNGDVLYNLIIQKGFNIIPSVDLPVFFYLNDANSYQKYVSLEIYLDSIGIAKPSEIIVDELNEIDKLKHVFLLDEICDLKVLNYFYIVFLNDNEVLNERKDILRKLISYDKTKSTVYLEELASITQKEKIKSIIKVVNDGKIRLNFSRIKDTKDINLENNFNRFIKFREFAKSNNLTVVDTHVLIENYLSEITTDSTKLQDASFVQFKSVFFEVVEHFLFSEEHGLDGDISTRIRHGVLENQIRKIFLNTNLIALKDKKGNYEDINYWNEYGENEGYLKNIITKFQEVLKKFSKSIDDKIDFMVNEQMQIYSNRHNKKKKGLFNYYFPEEYLWILYKQTTENVKDYDEFLNFSFDMIKEYTDALLFNIRENLKVKANTDFNSFMEVLEADIKKIFPVHADIFLELFQVINNTKFLIQKELDLISEWFKVSNPILDTSLDLKTIVETTVESINLIDAKNKIHAKIDIDSDIILQGFDYYIVIFGILLENINKHSGMETSDIYVDIHAKDEIIRIEENDLTCITIKVSNEVCNINAEKLDEIFKTIKENWNTRLDKVNIEGGSGFQKLKRILKYDIKCFDSEFYYELDNLKLILSFKIFLFYKNIENE